MWLISGVGARLEKISSVMEYGWKEKQERETAFNAVLHKLDSPTIFAIYLKEADIY